MTDRIKDMTAGKPAGLIFTFALPLMLGNIFQQLYTMVDTAVVGRGIGVDALAALGAADWLNWMALGLSVGLAQGFSILVSQRFGAGDLDGMRKAVAMSILLSVAIAVGFTVIFEAVAAPALRLMNTAEHIFDMSLTYLRISYGGIVIIMGYNILASVLRALGDSRTPLYAMVVAAFVNVVLDLLFVMVFHWGVAGAAIATVTAQLFSCVFCIRAICRVHILKLTGEDWRPDKSVMRRLLGLGAPVSFQNGIIAVGGMVVQSVVNRFGVVFVAGFTATNKLYGLLEIAATSFGYSVTTYMGQNLGAGRYKRIRQGMRSAVVMAIATSLVVSAVVILWGRNILSLFVSAGEANAPQVLSVAYNYLFVMGSMLFILYLLHIYRSALQGLGDTVTPMISGIVELIMRVGAALLLPALLNEWGIYLAEIWAWTGAAILLIAVYYVRVRKFCGYQDDESIQK